MAEARPCIPVIVGPTGVGKTAVAVALSTHWPITVISADSRQVYRDLDVGTAKPDAAVRARVPHLGLDLVAPGERYSAGRFARDAVRWLASIEDDRRPVVVGGTGLYVRAMTDGLFREPPIDPEARGRLREWASRAEGLGSWAARLDPAYSGGGRQRAARTVEVALLTGRPLSWWQGWARHAGVMRPWYVRLTVPRSYLSARIERRVRRMLDAGWIDEVRRLLDAGISPRAPGLDAVGYRQIVNHLEGELSEAALVPAIVTSTRRYARRQETWLRHQLGDHPMVTLDATEPPGHVAERIVTLWEGSA